MRVSISILSPVAQNAGGTSYPVSTVSGASSAIRFSGTEALLRVYAEARSPGDVDGLLAEGRRIAAPAG